MDRRITAPSLALVGVLLAAWFFLAPSLGSETTAKDNTGQDNGTTTDHTASTSSGLQSLFFTLLAPTATANLTTPGSESPRKQFEQLVRDYHSGMLSPEEKIQIKKKLREQMQTPLIRGFIIESFFSADDPQLAESLYGLIRDADLKDVSLLEGLIQHDSATPTATSKARIVDLIADLSTKPDAPYSAVIDGYLAQVAVNPDATLQNTAASQRIWYLAQHQPNNLGALKRYILDNSATVREEMYSLIESRVANQAHASQAELAEAVNAALQADYLGVSAQEKSRLTALLESLNGRAASF